MKTASHYTFSGPGRICISRGAPRGAAAGYKMFQKLAPSRDILQANLDEDAYAIRYRAEILDKLDPQETWDELHKLAQGAEPVIQCFERPPFTHDNFCHRRMAAAWFKETLGHDVDEVTPETLEQRRVRADERARAKAAPTLGLERRSSLPPIRPLVEAVRREIDAFWNRVCRSLGIERNWSWMGMPDRVLAQLEHDDVAEWQVLQDRYRMVD